MINNMEKSHILDICFGKLLTHGALRFLSGDLLALLIYIIEKSLEYTENSLTEDNRNKITTKIESLKKQCLYSDCFYAPALEKNLSRKEYYPIFRNPHLSRNEQCALKPFFKKNNFLYMEYFSKLTGILMVSRTSTAPMILGGADFDGDLVKIYFDDIISKAVLSGAYEKNDGNGKKQYKRKLPIINIPSTTSTSETIPDTIKYLAVKDTFGNRVGQISNMALKLGKIEYGTDANQNQKDVPYSAKCTLLTGLEIDAAKTGIHPNISEIENALRNQKTTYENDYFIERKNKFSSLKVNEKKTKEEFNNSQKRQNEENSQNKEDRIIIFYGGERIKIEKPGKNTPNIDALPYYYFENAFCRDKKEFLSLGKLDFLQHLLEKQIASKTLNLPINEIIEAVCETEIIKERCQKEEPTDEDIKKQVEKLNNWFENQYKILCQSKNLKETKIKKYIIKKLLDNLKKQKTKTKILKKYNKIYIYI